MLCTYCGGTERDSAGFCNNCGTKMVPQPPVRPEVRSTHHAPEPHKRDIHHHGGTYPTNVVPLKHPTPPEYSPAHARPAMHRTMHTSHAPKHPHHGYDNTPEFDYHPPHRGQQPSVTKAVVISVLVTMFVMSLGFAGFLFFLNGQRAAQSAVYDANIVSTPAPPYDNDHDADNIDEDSPPSQDHDYQDPYEDPYQPEEDISTSRFPFPGANITRYSSNTADIMFIQSTLNTIRRNYTSIRSIDTITGSYGGVTQGAVIDFQKRVELPITGIVDEATWYAIVDALENPPAEADPPFVPPVDAQYVTLVGLHLRDGPNQEAYSLGIQPVGTPVWVMSYIASDRWFFVTLEDGLAGYMKVEFLLLDGLLP